MNPSKSSPDRQMRSPTGCNAKPIHLGTRPAEREQIVAIHKQIRLSIAGTARLLTLLGLEQVHEKGLQELYRVHQQDLDRHAAPSAGQ